MCLSFGSPTTYVSRLHDSYEYSRDRRKMREQFEAYHAPPERRRQEIERYQSRSESAQHLKTGGSDSLLRTMSRRRKSSVNPEDGRGTSYNGTGRRTTGGISMSGGGDGTRSGGSLSSAWRSESWSQSQGGKRRNRSTSPWDMATAYGRDLYVMNVDPWSQTDDPWLLPPMPSMR